MSIYNSSRPNSIHLAQLAEWRREQRAKTWGLPLDTPAEKIDAHVTETHRRQNVKAYGLPADAGWDEISAAARANLYGFLSQRKVTPEA